MESGNKRCCVGWEEAFKKTKNDVNRCEVTTFARGGHCCVRRLLGTFDLLVFSSLIIR